MFGLVYRYVTSLCACPYAQLERLWLKSLQLVNLIFWSHHDICAHIISTNEPKCLFSLIHSNFVNSLIWSQCTCFLTWFHVGWNHILYDGCWPSTEVAPGLGGSNAIVASFYALKVNPGLLLLKTLTALGCGFDCGSKVCIFVDLFGWGKRKDPNSTFKAVKKKFFYKPLSDYRGHFNLHTSMLHAF